MSLGHLALINIVIEMGGNVYSNMHNELSTISCASQTYHGLLSMLILEKQFKMNVNTQDSKNATPLHFAAMYREMKNVEFLVSRGALVDAQDCQGHTPIHICLIRIIQEPDSFDDYKRIIKTLLFGGAKREMKTKQGKTALMLLEENKEVLETHEYNSLRFILSDYKECMCFQRHRPIRKVERSPMIIVTGLAMNVAIIVAFYGACL